LTHAGRVERSDASAFSIDQVDDALDALYLLLSFARGRNVSLVLHRGEGAAGERRWWRWLNATVDPWSKSHTWFDQQRPEQLSAMYSTLLTRWQDEDWRKPMQLGVYWYKLAQQNASTSEAAIVLAFTGLELVSWFHLVELTQKYTPSKIDNEDAAQKLRLFLTEIKVDVAIPPTPSDLTAYSATRGWADGPRVWPCSAMPPFTRNAETKFLTLPKGPFGTLAPSHYGTWSWDYSLCSGTRERTSIERPIERRISLSTSLGLRQQQNEGKGLSHLGVDGLPARLPSRQTDRL
jgi:hypothetical protein